MAAAIQAHQLVELEERGFTVLRGLVTDDHLTRFEEQIDALVAAQLAALGLSPRHRDPFIDLFTVGGDYTGRLYALLERLLILQRMSAHVVDAFEAADFFRSTGMVVPLVWPDIRADIPNDCPRLLPVHQDYRSMQCERAYRAWIPLRPSNERLGTMCAYAGTHRQGPVPHDLSYPLRPTIDPDRYRDCERVVFDLPAGDGVLLNPLIFHESIPNRSWRTKFTLMLQIQDLAAMIDPRAETFRAFGQSRSARASVEAAAGIGADPALPT